MILCMIIRTSYVEHMAMLRVNKPVSESVMADISKHIKAIASFYYDFG